MVVQVGVVAGSMLASAKGGCLRREPSDEKETRVTRAVAEANVNEV